MGNSRYHKALKKWRKVLTVAPETVSIKDLTEAADIECDVRYFPPRKDEVVTLELPWDRKLYKAMRKTYNLPGKWNFCFPDGDTLQSLMCVKKCGRIADKLLVTMVILEMAVPAVKETQNSKSAVEAMKIIKNPVGKGGTDAEGKNL